MNGKYTVRENGLVVARVDNLLTAAAKRAILEHLAGVTRTWASAVAVGALNTEPARTDRRLGFEIGRGSIDAKAADMDSSSVLVKATIPKRVEGSIYELGIYSANSQMGRASNQLMISDFNPEENDAEGVTSREMRVGRNGSELAALASTTATARFIDMGFDISAMSTNTRMVLAYNSQGINSVEVRLLNSPNDYLSYTFTPSSIYSSVSWRIENFVAVGQGDISRPFNEIQFLATAGAADGWFAVDGLRMDDTDVFDDQMLVSRAILTTPITKRASSEIEIEYSIKMDF